MSESVIFPLPDGATYTIPDVNDESWGQNVTDYLVALPLGVPPRSGTFSLTGDLDFGGTFGLKSNYFKSLTSNIATSGILRLAKTDSVGWRNNANSGNLLLSVNGSDQITFNGAILASAGSFLALSGGTMTGNIAMSGTQKLTGLAAGTTNGDSLRYEQLIGLYLLLAGGTMTGDLWINTGSLSLARYSLRIGDATPGPEGQAVSVQRIITDALDHDAYSVYDIYRQTGGGNSCASYSARPTIDTGNMVRLMGFQSAATASTSGSVSDLFGYFSGVTANGPGTVSTAVDLYAREVIGVGTVTTHYGIYIEEFLKAGTNYAIYTVGATPSVFNGPTQIGGTLTNDNAPAKAVGEYIESVVGPISFPATNNFGDAASISLTAGDWRVEGVGVLDANGSSQTNWRLGISTTTGNSGTGLVLGSNYLITNPSSGDGFTSLSIPGYRVSLSSTTTVYLKYFSTFGSATPKFSGRISATRVR